MHSRHPLGRQVRSRRIAALAIALVPFAAGADGLAGTDTRHASGSPPPAPVASRLLLAQTQAQQPQGETLQLGTPPSPPPGGSGGGLQLGSPERDAPGAEAGQTLQLGTPPPAQGGGLKFGAPADSAPAAPTLAPPEPERAVAFSVPWVRAEAGWLAQDGARADAVGYLSGAVRAELRPPGLKAWSVQATVRGDSYPQSGAFDDGTTRLDYGETFVRYDGARTRLTVGAQTVLWGRVDEIPPTDQMSVQDITRFTLDELPDRRRAVPALRLEHSFETLKLDAVLMPWFRPAELPDEDSIWFPVRREDGRIIAVGSQNALFNQAIRLGRVGRSDDFEDFGGAGLRVSRRGAGFDASVSVQRTRRSLPYYQIDPGVRAAVLRGVPLPLAIANGSGPTFREVHPLSWVAGGSFALEALGGTVRAEAAWQSDFPVTTVDARLETHRALTWVGGYEFFPGDGNTRVTLQVAGLQVFDTPATLDRTRVYSVSGEVEIPFAQERWRFDTRFSLGLNDRDVYLNPKLSYVGWEPHEIYLGAHLFSGSDRTFSGFFADNDLVVLGWRAQF